MAPDSEDKILSGAVVMSGFLRKFRHELHESLFTGARRQMGQIKK